MGADRSYSQINLHIIACYFVQVIQMDADLADQINIYSNNIVGGNAVVNDFNSFPSNIGQSGTWYDRNERLQSTSAFTAVNCFGVITLADLIDPAGLGNAANGGYSMLAAADLDLNGDAAIALNEDYGILVQKAETNGVRSVLTSENRVDW